MATKNDIKDKNLYTYPLLEDYHPEPIILPRAEVLRKEPDENQQMAAPLVRCGVLKDNPSVVVYMRGQEGSTAGVNDTVQFVLAEPTKEEARFDEHLAFDEKWTGEVGQWRGCADTVDQQLDAWKQYLVKVILKNAPESEEIVGRRQSARKEGSPARVGDPGSTNAEGVDGGSDGDVEGADGQTRARVQAHFAHTYPDLKSHKDVWDAFNWDKADPPFDTEDEDILSKVALSWVPVMSALPDAVSPPNSMLRQALQEVRNREARQVTQTKTYMTWQGNQVLGSAPEKELSWGSYEETIGKVERMTPLKRCLGFDIPDNLQMPPEYEEYKEVIRRVMRQINGPKPSKGYT
ncbi:hypothetical protein KC343_g739 [Hortaea werneckii]|nr:hypothetical protein KC352_g4495 [Hortaea werneckii]KAI7572432.1 hypothetical protein KC317_g771 [Hortaea werneckii]KAI7627505.1 hypothetical protein KC346_g712 [Hortaea werneckii]KAI7637399.1 hypothetical protein KC343_g739 [Hortaea werneckii]KAI7683099.1 hypothetical protein KC319_g641 [Hortaea werneckii]